MVSLACSRFDELPLRIAREERNRPPHQLCPLVCRTPGRSCPDLELPSSSKIALRSAFEDGYRRRRQRRLLEKRRHIPEATHFGNLAVLQPEESRTGD